jgi:ParB/RepB/Spo0J family partition protein
MRPDGLRALAESIRLRGLLQPIRVLRQEEGYLLIAGERRWRATQMLGWKTIPAMVVADQPATGLQIDALVENIHREDLTARERARALTSLRVTLGLQSWEEVGRRLGLSRVHVHRLLNTDKLPEEIQVAAGTAKLTEKHVRALHYLRQSPLQQRELWKEILDNHLTGEGALRRSVVIKGTLRDEPCGQELGPSKAHGTGEVADLLDQVVGALDHATTNQLRQAVTRLEEIQLRIRERLQEPGSASR